MQQTANQVATATGTLSWNVKRRSGMPIQQLQHRTVRSCRTNGRYQPEWRLAFLRRVHTGGDGREVRSALNPRNVEQRWKLRVLSNPLV